MYTYTLSSSMKKYLSWDIATCHFNRIYFSVITGTTLGYGDIYPVSNTLKLLSMVQSISTIILILI